jgi:ribosome recycling factor
MIGTGHGQVALRNIRRNAIEAVKKLEKGTTPISEDESKSMQVRVTL